MRKGSFYSKPRKISISEYSNKNTSIRDEDLFKTKINFVENNKIKVPKLIFKKDNFSTTSFNSFKQELRELSDNNKLNEIEEKIDFHTNRDKSRRSLGKNNSVISRYIEEVKKKRHENELTFKKIKSKRLKIRNPKLGSNDQVKPKKKETNLLANFGKQNIPSDLQENSYSPMKLQRLNTENFNNKSTTHFDLNRKVSLGVHSSNDLVSKLLNVTKRNVPKSEKSRIFNKNLSTKNIFSNDQSKVHPITIKEPKETYRISSFDVQPNSKWKELMGLENKKTINKSIEEVDYQSTVIISELKVIIDSIQQFKVNYVSRSNILEVIRTMERKSQMKYNKMMEETCGLLMKMPEIFLVDFYHYLDRLISAQPPLIESKEIRNEELNFCYNVKLLNEIAKYIKACFEVYTIVVKQVDDVLIPKKDFNILCEYFERTRYHLSLLTMTIKNALKNMFFDMNIVNRLKNCSVDKVRPSLLGSESERGSLLSNARETIRQNEHGEITEKMRHQFHFKNNEETQKSSRLKNILSNTAGLDERKNKKKYVKSILHSELMTKLLHYCTNDIKDKVMSERIIIRYKDKEKELFDK